MTGVEAWIGNCHLRRVGGDGGANGGEYQCLAAVWADGSETFRTRLAAHVEKQGYSILWLEEVLSATNYLSRHGSQRKIGPLARAVYEGHPVELGRLVPVGAEGEPEEAESDLIIEEIEGVEPLDAQPAAWPKKSVPDWAVDLLFGQPEPTEAEIAQYGSAEAVPPLKTYIILDAAKLQWGFSEIEKCGMPYRCLFKGKAAEELQDVAPYVIELDPETCFTRRLFKHDPDMPEHMTSVHLWRKEPGIYVRSRLPTEAICAHFRHFTRVRNESGAWFVLRFYDPYVIMDLAEHLEDENKRRVFAPGIEIIALSATGRDYRIRRRDT